MDETVVVLDTEVDVCVTDVDVRLVVVDETVVLLTLVVVVLEIVVLLTLVVVDVVTVVLLTEVVDVDETVVVVTVVVVVVGSQQSAEVHAAALQLVVGRGDLTFSPALHELCWKFKDAHVAHGGTKGAAASQPPATLSGQQLLASTQIARHEHVASAGVHSFGWSSTRVPASPIGLHLSVWVPAASNVRHLGLSLQVAAAS